MPKVRKYVESHWLIYAFQGIVSLVFGGYILFAINNSIPALATFVGVTLLCLGVIELFNLLHRKHFGGSLALSLILAITEIVIAMLIIFTRNGNMIWPLTLIAIYTIGRGILEIVLSFVAMTDKTDRFMWTVCGICACIIGIVILNSGDFVSPTAFLKFFGSYMMIYGVTNLFYGIHNRNELKTIKAEAAQKRRERAKARKAEVAETIEKAKKSTAKSTKSTSSAKAASSSKSDKSSKSTKSTKSAKSTKSTK